MPWRLPAEELSEPGKRQPGPRAGFCFSPLLGGVPAAGRGGGLPPLAPPPVRGCAAATSPNRGGNGSLRSRSGTGDWELATPDMVKTRRTSAIPRRRGRTNPRSPGPGGPSWSRHLPRGANGHSFLVAAVSARPPPGSYKNFHSSWTTSSLRNGDCATQRRYWLRRFVVPTGLAGRKTQDARARLVTCDLRLRSSSAYSRCCRR